MYPLGDGRGGVLRRKRWRGGSPRPQQVRHIGTPISRSEVARGSSIITFSNRPLKPPFNAWVPHCVPPSVNLPFYQGRGDDVHFGENRWWLKSQCQSLRMRAPSSRLREYLPPSPEDRAGE